MIIDQNHFYNSIAHYYDQIFPLNQLQLQFIESQLQNLTGKNILDVGCSTGKLAGELAKKGSQVVGIDLNPEMIKLAKNEFSTTNIDFREADMLNINLDFSETHFDGIVCFGNTLVHLSNMGDVSSFFQKVSKQLKPGGKFMVQILNYDYILEQKITSLPLIDTGKIGFIRKYDLPAKPDDKIIFNTELIIKETRDSHFHASYLLPLRKAEIEVLLNVNGFGKARYYANFDKRPYGGNHLPLIFVAEKYLS